MVSQLACPICASPTREVLWPSARVPDAATMVRCTSCRYIYRAQDTGLSEPAPAHPLPEADAPWPGWLAAVEEAVGRSALLNLGAGPLPFLQLARDAGWRVAEIEPDHLLSAGRWPAGSFDAVTIWNGLEDSPRPATLISAAAYYLRVDGVLAIRALNAVQAGTPPPTRLFPPTALQRFLSRYGFRIERSLSARKATTVLLARYVP